MLDDETPIDDITPNDDTSIISVEELKKRLHLADIDYTTYTDEDLAELIQLTVERIEAETGLPITAPRLITEYVPDQNGRVYETDYYPILCSELRLDDELIEPHRTDTDRGIFYFRPSIKGELEVRYQIQYTDLNVLTDLITNMIILTVDGDTVHGTWNSIREEGVSVTYGAGSGGLTEKVTDALNKLKGYYKPRCRLL